MVNHPPHTRVTRDDWVGAARAVLIEFGVDRVKVAVLAEQLDIARSSFYWYFSDREDLLNALLDAWELHNASSIVERANRPADTLISAILNVFECWADPSLFDPQLEFAIRDWARRDDAVRERLATADQLRLDALTKLHRRFGASPKEALVRARVQYHSQIGMYALGVDETHEVRLSLLPAYLRVFSSEEPTPAELKRFRSFVKNVAPTA